MDLPDRPEPASSSETPDVGGPRTLAEYLQGPPRVSQRWLADQVGVNQSMISMLSRGERAARGKLATDLHEKTGVPIETLIIATHPPPRAPRKTKKPPTRRRRR